MAEKSNADLLAEIISIVESQTAPDTIKPTTLDDVFKDINDSMANKVDGIRVGLGYGTDTAFSLPAYFNDGSITDNMRLKDAIQALMNKISATNVLVTGGVQGREGEFLATVIPQAVQRIVVNDNTQLNGYVKIATINLINDKDNGSFDNGNNFLINRFITPAGGQPSIRYTASGLVLEFVDFANDIASSPQTRTMKLVIANNGTPISGVLSEEFHWENTVTPMPKTFYIKDFSTGLAGISIAAAAKITLDLWAKQNYFTPTSAKLGGITLEVKEGIFYNEIV